VTAQCWALHTRADLEQVNVHLAALQATGLLGIVEAGGCATVYLPRRVEGLPFDGRWEAIPERDWDAVWRAGIQPVTAGSVTVTPPWIDAGPDAIVIEPGQAFGTGHHETTLGCLSALQSIPLEGRTVLDVGTGSGVLAICASRRGAARVVGVDTDPLAVEAATANARRNRATVDVRLGSVDAAPPERFDVVVANLDTSTLGALAASLAGALTEAGTLVASGVSLERLEEARGALEAAGLVIDARPGREWAVLFARQRKEAPAQARASLPAADR